MNALGKFAPRSPRVRLGLGPGLLLPRFLLWTLLAAGAIFWGAVWCGSAQADEAPNDGALESSEEADDALQAGDLERARIAIERAIHLAPNWAAPYAVRARLRVQRVQSMTDPDALKRDLQAIGDGTGNEDHGDYEVLLRGVEGATQDYERYLDLKANAPEADLGPVRVEVRRLKGVAELARACVEAVSRREKARREAVSEARIKADEARRLVLLRDEERWNTDRNRIALRRRLGYGLIGAGLAGLALGGVFAALGAEQNQAIKSGGFATANDIENALALGAADNTGVGIAVAVGASSLIAGTVLAVLYRDPGPFDAGISLLPEGGLKLFATVRFP